jgi:peroxiredoxin
MADSEVKTGEGKPAAPTVPATPARRIDLLGHVAFAAYMVIGGVFVFGFGRTLTSAIATQNETPCRSLLPRHALVTGRVLDEGGNPVTKGEVEAEIKIRTGPVALRADGTFAVHVPEGKAQVVTVRAPGKAPVEVVLDVKRSQVIDVEVRLAKAGGKGEPGGQGSFVEKGRTPWLAPDFTVVDLEGKQVRLSDFRGKLVVLNFWATWCEPCTTEWPQVAKLARRLQDEGHDEVVVLAVSIDGDRATIGPFLQLMTLFESPVKVLWDESTTLHEQFGSEKIPDTFFVDEEGRVSAVFVNVREWGSPDALHCVESSARG